VSAVWLVALAALAQAPQRPRVPPPEVTASVDRTRLRLGEDVTLTIRARTRASEPLDLVLPPLTGLGVVASREFTQVSFSAETGPSRTLVRELQLKVERAGSLVIGAVRARQGSTVVETAPITLTVDTTSALPAELSPIARRLLEGAPPPRRADAVALTVIVPDDTILAGQQLDVVAAAWFPRELATRLRRPPVVQLGTPAGVWAYSQPAPTGVALSRLVDGQWMDLVVAHQIVFPLAPGRVVIQPARLMYAVPVTFSFFSREERYSFHTDSVPITVLPLPAAGRPADDLGIVGQGLSLDVTIEPIEVRAGEPLEVTATVTGTGNVALWPEPVLRWPSGFRPYPAESDVRIEPRDGRIRGTKVFRSLVVPDSAGQTGLPDVRYPYYDLGQGTYVVATARLPRVAVLPGLETRAARSLPPLEPAGGHGLSRFTAGLGAPVWAIAWLGPPLLLLAARRRRAAPRAATPVAARPARLASLERDFLGLLDAHVPDAAVRGGPGLAHALRAAGVEGPVADHVVRLRERLRAARYGPDGVGDAAELAAEVEQVLRVLGGASRRHHRVGPALALLIPLLLGVVAPGRLSSQAHSAEALYRAGALRAAADSFAARAAAAPAEAAHWYNLGATLYRAGADGKAVAAWTLAARLAPRDATIRTGRSLIPPPDGASARLLTVGLTTPTEALALAALGWAALWVALWRRARLAVLVAALLCIGAGALGALEWRRRGRPVAVVVENDAGVRDAPHGAAPTSGRLPAGSAVLIGRHYGRWIEVQRGDGIHGWVRDSDVAPL
jgi:hypothetical protein